MKLYHGTDYVSAMSIFNKGINLSYTRSYNDFGRGFYTSTSLEKAKKWSMYKSSQVDSKPCAVVFEFDSRKASGFITKYTDRDCAFFCAKNRTQIFEHNNIITVGKIADSNIAKLMIKLKKMNFKFDADDVSYIINPNDTNLQYAFHKKKGLKFLSICYILVQTGEGKWIKQ